jgi:DNA ligase (NAD+)
MNIEDVQSQIEQLRGAITEHDYRYHAEAAPVISDQEYDRLFRELKDLETEYPQFQDAESPTRRVGAMPLDGFAQMTHLTPMMSLDNTYSEEEVAEFFRRLERLVGKPGIETVIEPKVDGVAISLLYKNGLLESGATRGNGVVGDDVSQNVRTIRTLPLKLRKPFPDLVEIRGEVYLSKKTFAQLNIEREKAGEPLFANPRNTAAGSLKQLDPALVAKRRLSILCYGFGRLVGEEIATHREALARLAAWGLPTHDKIWTAASVDEVITAIHALNQIRHDFAYETDGAVVKVDAYNFREQVGSTSKAPRWAMAFKYQAERAETKLLSIEVQIGRSGKLTPVANLDPVLVSGTTVARATLHNGEEIRRKDIRVGDVVVIEKAGEIIPAVVEVLVARRTGSESVFEMPHECPSCGQPVKSVEGLVDLRCTNVECPEQVKRRLEHFAHKGALDIEGLGEMMVAQLVDRDLVKRIDHIYGLNEIKLATLERMGAKSISNLLSAIEESKKRPLWRLIFGLGILHVGATAARELAAHFRTMSRLSAAPLEEFLKVTNTGAVVATSLKDFFQNTDNQALLEVLHRHGLNFGELDHDEPVGNAFEGTSWVITGSLSEPREAFEKLIRANAGRVSSSVSKKTTYLLAGEEAGNKLEKAKSFGVKIIEEAAFREMLSD